MAKKNDFVILPTGPNGYMAEGVALCLGKQALPIQSAAFSDGHMIRRIVDTVRRKPVYLVQTYIAGQPYQMLTEVGQMLNAAFHASAARRTVVMPKAVGDRQDRINQAGEPIEVQEVAEELESKGMDSLIVVRPHFAQYSSVVRRPTLMLSGLPLFAYHLRQQVENYDELCFVAADGGAEKETRLFMEIMGSTHYATVIQGRKVTDKTADSKILAGVSGVEHIQGRHCVFIEDIVESGTTASNAAQAVMDAGAKSAVLYAPHLGLSGKAPEYLNGSPLSAVIGLDTVYHPPEFLAQFEKVKIISCVPMLADVIKRDRFGESTRLFACLDRVTLATEPEKMFELVERVYREARKLTYDSGNQNHRLLQDRVANLF
ncbi:MAG: ribose-phosphate diphosphokinase [Candidatus Woesearchaeota archaeon]|nr:ribose-phosphate diphosphokinase [Candidatus Woesearchaeota archaeon]